MHTLSQARRCIGAVCLAMALAAPGFADEKPAGPKKAATPEQAVEFLAAASKAGDVEAALGQIAQPFHDVMRWFILLEEADDIVNVALDAKFGKDQRKGFRMEVKYDTLRIKKSEVLTADKKSDTRVKLSIRETVKSFQHDGDDVVETSYLAIKEGDQWKLLRPFTALIFGADEKDITQKTSRTKDANGKEVTVFKLTFNKDLVAMGEAM